MLAQPPRSSKLHIPSNHLSQVGVHTLSTHPKIENIRQQPLPRKPFSDNCDSDEVCYCCAGCLRGNQARTQWKTWTWFLRTHIGKCAAFLNWRTVRTRRRIADMVSMTLLSHRQCHLRHQLRLLHHHLQSQVRPLEVLQVCQPGNQCMDPLDGSATGTQVAPATPRYLLSCAIRNTVVPIAASLELQRMTAIQPEL